MDTLTVPQWTRFDIRIYFMVMHEVYVSLQFYMCLVRTVAQISTATSAVSKYRLLEMADFYKFSINLTL